MARYKLNESIAQVEAPRLIQGLGRYADDIKLDRQSYAAFLRSPHAHADIVSIDTARAARMPGVVAILTGEDWADDGMGPVGGLSPTKRRDGAPLFRPPRPGLTRDRVRHVGQAIALVVAETPHQAKDAVEAIEVQYSPLPVQLSTEAANKPGAPAIWEDCPDNESMYVALGDRDKADKAMALAAHIVRDKFVVSRIAANTIEPRSVVASWDPGYDHYTIYACLQRPYVWRSVMCSQTFRIPENRMTLIPNDIGGSFGMKGGLYIEPPVIAWASKRVGRPVKWTCERSEGHLADDQGRDMVVSAELGFDDDGHFLAMRFTSNNNLGAFVPMLGLGACRSMVESVAGPYLTPALFAEAAGVMTNTVHVANYRAPGRAPGTYVVERLVDMAARKLDIDPVEIRRRNLVPPDRMPYAPTKGIAYDCGEFEAVMDKCLTAADYAGVNARKMDARTRGKLRGVGIATIVDPSAGPQPETAELRFDPSGSATLLVGTTAGGQSHATIYAQIICDKLGIDSDRLRIIEGDTDKVSWGTGTGSARVATIGGSTVFKAAEKVVEKAKRIAAHLMEASAADIEFVDGRFTVAGTDRTIAFEAVARAAFQPARLPPEIEIGLYETATWQPPASNVPYACQICEVEIDPDTGALEIVRYTETHDVGLQLNPALVDAQIHGGIAQAAGQALMEQIVYDDDGQLLTGSFMDYCMPRASDFCSFDLSSHVTLTKTNPLGVKGVGECGTVGGIAAVMNAVHDALAPLGVTNLSMPATPQKIWKAIRDAGRAQENGSA